MNCEYNGTECFNEAEHKTHGLNLCDYHLDTVKLQEFHSSTGMTKASLYDRLKSTSEYSDTYEVYVFPDGSVWNSDQGEGYWDTVEEFAAEQSEADNYSDVEMAEMISELKELSKVQL